MPKKPNPYPFNDSDDRWVSTAQSSFQRIAPSNSPQQQQQQQQQQQFHHHQAQSPLHQHHHAQSPPSASRVASSRDGHFHHGSMMSPQQQKRDELYAAWASATSPQAAAVSRSWEGVHSARPLPEHDPRVDWQPTGTFSTGGVAGITAANASSPFLSASKQRAQTPPPGGTYQRSSFATSNEKPIRHGRKPVASRCTDDHIVFENTRYEDSTDPLCYAQHRRDTDGPGPHAHTRMQVHSHHAHYNSYGHMQSPDPYARREEYIEEEEDEEEEDGTDWQGLVEQFGFPGKRHTVARRRLCTHRRECIVAVLVSFKTTRSDAASWDVSAIQFCDIE
ncbi:Hypothetical protein, putative [Bodo saltans]|uniref:Uncharacterized protein n=1 Tax=Bodo saltans TaxID=75058 RepID=A0A0S4J5Q6_BODSA|nr:Hypothetical protein, putative [Bodo saltans]|eukprot:CUG78690.1 Hypothetical protein, putative [Bodo saltans]